MDRRLLIGLSVFLLIVGAASVTDSLSFALDPGCEWQPLEIDGEQFETIDAFEAAADRRGVDLTEIRTEFEFRETGDGVEYRSLSCGIRETGGDRP